MIPVLTVQSGPAWNRKHNDEKLWQFGFSQLTNGIPKPIDAITCDEYITKYLGNLNEDQKS